MVAVTKGFGPEAVTAALEVGLFDIGENYAAELLSKAAALEPLNLVTPPRWHYLGAVQRNKVARLAPRVSVWQAVARPEEASAIARRSGDGAEIFVEVDLSLSPGRGGCRPEEVGDLVAAARSAGCRVRGLMTVAPFLKGGSPEGALTQSEVAREAFAGVAHLAASLGLGELSMGMSDDLEEAVAAGTTMVRVGTALFGPRPRR